MKSIFSGVIFLLLCGNASAQSSGNSERLHNILQFIRPGAQWSASGTTCNDIVWLDQVQAKPTCAEIDAGLTALRAANTSEASRQAAIKNNARRVALLQKLKTSTDAQIDTYVQQNVTTLAQAQTAIADILKLIALDARQ